MRTSSVPPALPVVRVRPGSFGTGQDWPAFSTRLNRMVPCGPRTWTQLSALALMTSGLAPAIAVAEVAVPAPVPEAEVAGAGVADPGVAPPEADDAPDDDVAEDAEVDDDMAVVDPPDPPLAVPDVAPPAAREAGALAEDAVW
ncbi:hypothetical protein, partial [Acidiphilium sp. PM]|uniref:hypothetical protein n=1 Tax=Acidiphilium sp. PM TaxID=1043206 RepID=UPI001F525A3E